MIHNAPKELKDRATTMLEASEEDEVLKLVAQLKVTLLPDADAGWDGGLNEHSRRRAWDMVRDLGKILLGRGRPQ
jgi:hypothetical protein